MASLDEENDSSSSYESDPEEMALDSKEDDSEVVSLYQTYDITCVVCCGFSTNCST